jgi:ATP-dependent RNA helicase DDX52/ROK1
VSQETAKPLALRQLVHEGLAVPCLVFTSTRKRAQTAAEEIAASSSRFTSRVALVHAGMGEGDRRKAISRFREGAAWILVATDLVARGMDFVGLATVINVDLPQSRAEYVHRVGRAGRAGQRGHAVSLFTEDDWRDLRPIAEAVRSSGSDVADWMLKMPKVDKRKPRSERSSMLQTPEKERERNSAHGEKKQKKETTKSNKTVSEQLRKSLKMQKKSYES